MSRPYPTPSGWKAACSHPECDFIGRGFDAGEAVSARVEHTEANHADPAEEEAEQ